MEDTLTEIVESDGVEVLADKNYVARFGSFILRRGADAITHGKLHKALVSALG